MQLSPKQVEKLLNSDFKFTVWSLAALVTRLKQQYAGSPASLQTFVTELNAFIEKYSSILGDDIALLEKI